MESRGRDARLELALSDLVHASTQLTNLREVLRSQGMDLVLQDARQRVIGRVPRDEGLDEGTQTLGGSTDARKPYLNRTQRSGVTDPADLVEQVRLRTVVNIYSSGTHLGSLSDLPSRRCVVSTLGE